VDIGTSLVAHPQPPVLMKPGDGALDHPALSAETGAVRIAWPGDPDFDPAAVQLAPWLP
jgi:hypothetical protein